MKIKTISASQFVVGGYRLHHGPRWIVKKHKGKRQNNPKRYFIYDQAHPLNPPVRWNIRDKKEADAMAALLNYAEEEET